MDTIAFLSRLPLFEALNDKELTALADICEPFEFEPGAVIGYQRDVTEHMYIVQEGHLVGQSVDNDGRVTSHTRYHPGDHFGESWLFSSHPHPATVRASTGGILLMLFGPNFMALVKRMPSMLEKIEFAEETWFQIENSSFTATGRKQPVSKLLPDEIVEYYGRRTHWLLLIKLIAPTFCLILLPFFVNILTNAFPGFSGGKGFWLSIIIPLIIIGLWVLVLWMDWHNDFFVVTNKHLVHTEFFLDPRRFGSRTHTIPIDQVQSVEIEKPSFITNLLNVGTARITTSAAASVIYFDFIHNPIQVKDAIDELSMRVRALDSGREQQIMRQSIESHFQKSLGLTPLNSNFVHTSAEYESDSLWKKFKEGISYRTIEGRNIIYRRHLFALARDIAVPFIIAVVLTIFAFLALQISVRIFLVVLALLISDILWLIWQVEDWRNDTFLISDRFVIDIDRQPFGFGESRKQTDLGNVQNVNVDKVGILPTLFNYGDVIIETAGAKSDIVFERVAHPNEIQTEIFKRRDDYKRQQKKMEQSMRRREYALVMDVYQQAMEQGRIPRRTPPPMTDELSQDEFPQE